MNNNGSPPGKTCEGCSHFRSKRPLDKTQIPVIYIGDCDKTLFPLITGINPQGVQQIPGGVYLVALANGYCGSWSPRLSVLAGLSATDAETRPKAGT